MQVVRESVNSFRYTKSLRRFFTHRDIGKIKWMGDNRIPRYFFEVERLFKDLEWPEESKRDFVLEHCDQVEDRELRTNLDVFRMKAPADLSGSNPEYCYTELKAILMRHVERELQKKNLKQREVNRD